MSFVITQEIYDAVKRLLDKDAYSTLKIYGDRAEYEQFYKDVNLCAEFVAGMITHVFEKGARVPETRH